MSLNYDLVYAESDVAHINLNKEYDELITDIKAVYNRHRYTFKNALGEDSGEIVDLLVKKIFLLTQRLSMCYALKLK